MSSWQRGDQIEATFVPKVTGTLRQRAHRLVGTRLRLYCGWAIEPEDGGDYVGQHAWLLADRPENVEDDPGWIPTEDLADIVAVEHRAGAQQPGPPEVDDPQAQPVGVEPARREVGDTWEVEVEVPAGWRLHGDPQRREGPCMVTLVVTVDSVVGGADDGGDKNP